MHLHSIASATSIGPDSSCQACLLLHCYKLSSALSIDDSRSDAVVSVTIPFSYKLSMVNTKVTTVIVNATKHGLTMKVGSRNCYAKLTSFKVGSEYHLKLDVNWTYQEFVVQDKCNTANRLYLSSDDCCDCERITIQENADGKLAMHTLLRSQFRIKEPCSAIVEEDHKEPKEPAEDGNVMSSCKAWVYRFCRTYFLA